MKVGLIAALVLVVTACGSSSASLGATRPTTSSAPPTSTPTLASTPLGTPTPTAVPTLATGQWTGIHWSHLQTKTTAEVWLRTSGSGPFQNGNVTESGWTVFGWDKGYVAFDVVTTKPKKGASTVVIQTEHSLDGISWSAGQSFVPPTFAPRWGEQDTPRVDDVIPGPSGLLAYEYYDCVCVCPTPTIHPLAASPDGVNWQTVKGSVVSNWLGAGGAGYVATEGTEVQISQDGISWIKAKVIGTATARIDRLDSGASFAGGFVVSSETFKGMTQGSMCVNTPIPFNPAVWYSADGRSWDRQTLPGADLGLGQSIEVCRINDGLLLAVEPTASGWLHWNSTDGRTWTSVATDLLCGEDSQAYGFWQVDNRYFNLVPSDPDLLIEVLGPDLQYAYLHQTGDAPDWHDIWYGAYGVYNVDYAVALGPAGVIVSDGRGNLWVGMPTTG